MAVALRSRLRLSSIASRNGSQKLVDRARFGSFGLESLNSTPNPVVTSFSLAGFAVSAFALPFVERFSVLVSVLSRPTRWSPRWPVLPAVAVPTSAADALRSRPLSGRHRRSPDAPRSLARCAVVAIRVVPGLSLVVNRARLRFRKIGGTALHRQRRGQTLAHANRQQLHRRLTVPKPSRQVEPTPAKHLICVDPMRPRHTCY